MKSKNNGKIGILRSRPEDYRGIVEVYYKTWLDTYPNKKYKITVEDIKYMYRNRNKKEEILKRQKDLEHPKKGVKKFVANYNDKVVGVCTIIIDDKQNQLKAIYVLPKYQGKGIGYMLWKNAQKYFNKKKKTIVQVAVYNNKAIGFYKKLGFKKTGKYFMLDKTKMRNGAHIPETELVIKPKHN